MMPRFEDQENMDDEEMELVLNAIEYIKGLNHTKIKYQKNSPTSANFCEWANSRAEPRRLSFGLTNSLFSIELSIGMPLDHIQFSSEPSRINFT